MLGLILYISLMMLFLGLAVRSAFRPAGTKTSGASREEAGAPGGPEAGNTAAEPASLEGVLAAQLLRGEISHGQYQHALERLAARDDVERPLSVPRNGDSGAGT
ncbi:hypothetical protein [Actinoplanes sp. L3-i22]|uniref:hypothetical protein n=1 Tax=Actinoplanes sp. L3-i22 TaxID=2836373 RepID=UPI001C79796B|nr:hypothetical protein [Actinoplanes sp. L3-i22]BCY09421.1 hypothetical protein L3i22_045090 [Actinoplanes sp. L3-i22]